MTTANALLERCSELLANGESFPTMWETVLRAHPLVREIPVQGRRDEQPVLRVALYSGQTLVFIPSRRSVMLE
ncbi:hypothetical protein G6M87_24460 [Rhizobium rhizogenes]|uniref:hypothetical protein n=1 Tax=Rhizobium rhizogenes TaxID=359 RepID=UPI0015725C49|nr:hypothetical protein [Rhizobium rhizogenes]NTF85481.1 hypothetical protein [Rhizobium rhizogenes]NTI26664.1 hypothetical protein [Rhizobium rhizogenes]NTI31306.1 hypothetical protein [Rhizobium rhizogenes]NTI78941.1 hypothetical protein [Rhizobium rhizogenes]QTG08641.1 hypothetical protein G6M87_24460 [Rhizobium rhizogenes]